MELVLSSARPVLTVSQFQGENAYQTNKLVCLKQATILIPQEHQEEILP
jgi:hypothetical protein